MDSFASSPRWVERLFARLQVRYGARWTRLWEGIDPDAVREDWRDQLWRIFDRNPQAIVYALDRLPADNPPTSAQFLALCMQAPASQQALPPPASAPPDKAFAAAVAERIAAAKPPARQSPSAELAERLSTFEARTGQPLSAAQRSMLRAVARPASAAGGASA